MSAQEHDAEGRGGIVQAVLRTFPARVVKRYVDAQGPNWATLIAWNMLFALFPIILVTVTILGAVLHDPGIAANLEKQIANVVPNQHDRDTVFRALNDFKGRSGLFGVIGFVGLLWSGSGLFGAIEQGLTALYPCKPRDFVQQKLMAFAMIFLFTLLTVPLLLSSSLLSAVQSLSFVPGAFRSGPASLLLQLGAGVFDGMLLFTAIYYVVPHRRQRFRDVLPGAAVAGVLLEGLTLLFPLYFKLSGGFATYGAAFALFFLLLAWAFFLGQITMIGGAVNAERQVQREADPLAECSTGPGTSQQALRTTVPPGRPEPDGDGEEHTVAGEPARRQRTR